MSTPKVWWSPTWSGVFMDRVDDAVERVFTVVSSKDLPEDAVLLVPAQRQGPRVWTEPDFTALRRDDPPEVEHENQAMVGLVRRWGWPDGRVRSWRETAERGLWIEAKT